MKKLALCGWCGVLLTAVAVYCQAPRDSPQRTTTKIGETGSDNSARMAVVQSLLAAPKPPFPETESDDFVVRMEAVASLTDRALLTKIAKHFEEHHPYEDYSHINAIARFRLFQTDPPIERRLGRTRLRISRTLMPGTSLNTDTSKLETVHRQAISFTVSGGKLKGSVTHTWACQYPHNDSMDPTADAQIYALISTLIANFPQVELAGLTAGGMDSDVRRAAIGHLTDQQVLAEIEAGDDPLISQEAKSRLEQLRKNPSK